MKGWGFGKAVPANAIPRAPAARPAATLSAVAILAALSGCAGEALPPTVHVPDIRPADWDQTPVLEVFGGMRAHSADQELQAGDAGWAKAVPVACQAYQDGRHARGDTCRVVTEAPVHWFGEGPRPTWYVDASWDGSGEDLIEQERDESRRTVVAFDAAAKAVAHVPRAVAMAIE